ncbi:MAG: aldose 1-epimerase [Hafniaceae bacterium]|nr:aldose 1-epimerase [Hafniaceae bacterium]
MMDIYTLSNPRFRLRVTPQSAAILSFDDVGSDTAILRPYQRDTGWHPGESALFPMLPLANRVRDNRFCLAGREICLPDSALDNQFFLHGDGWLQRWQLQDLSCTHITLGLRVQHSCGFDYSASLVYRLTDEGLSAHLTLRHCGAEPMLYGLGFHPFFVKTPQTQIQFSSSGYWPEGELHLPLAWQGNMPASLDFTRTKVPDNAWMNHGYSGWNGVAHLATPNQPTISLRSSASYLMLFQMPDEPFICLEPQSHPVDAHNMDGQPGLVLLGKGEMTEMGMRVEVND